MLIGNLLIQRVFTFVYNDICSLYFSTGLWRNLGLNRLEYHRTLRIYAFIRGLLYLIFLVNGENTIQHIFYSKLKTENVLPWRIY